MEEARDPELTNELITFIREGDLEGVRKELQGIDDVDIALVIIFLHMFYTCDITHRLELHIL